MKSATRGHDSIVVFTDIRDHQGKSVIVPIRFTKSKRGITNQITSIYPREREFSFLFTQWKKENFLYASTIKSSYWVRNTRLQLPRTLLNKNFKIELSIAKKKGGVKYYRGNYYFQTAWHGSPRSFDRFDTNAVGTGTGRKAHGWGLYFAQEQGAAKQYQDKLMRREAKKAGEDPFASGSLLKVDIPENEVLLDEDKPLNEQPEAVRKAIAAYYQSRPIINRGPIRT